MGIVYPGAIDNFTTPSSPETTPLSEAGDATRNHTELLHDQGLALEAVETYKAERGHDHSGDANDRTKGAKLSQANTHENADTNSAPTSIHHTLETTTGVNPNKAAPANHIHDYTDGSRLLHTPYRVVTSTTRPTTDLFNGLLIYETDTHRFRVRDQYTGEGSPSWKLLPLTYVPVVRLIQTHNQSLSRTGSVIEWDSELEDNNNFFNHSTSATDIIIAEEGLYHIDAAVQWNSSAVPDQANVWLTVNGQDTTVRNHMPMRGNTVSPGFSQTLPLSGKYRFNAGDVARIKVSYTNAGGIINFFFSFFDTGSKINSRIELGYMGP